MAERSQNVSLPECNLNGNASTAWLQCLSEGCTLVEMNCYLFACKPKVICVITDENIGVLFMKYLCDLCPWPDCLHTP